MSADVKRLEADLTAALVAYGCVSSRILLARNRGDAEAARALQPEADRRAMEADRIGLELHRTITARR